MLYLEWAKPFLFVFVMLFLHFANNLSWVIRTKPLHEPISGFVLLCYLLEMLKRMVYLFVQWILIGYQMYTWNYHRDFVYFGWAVYEYRPVFCVNGFIHKDFDKP